MSGLSFDGPRGVLRPGWSARVDDYAIAGGWTARGEALVVGDAAGGVYAFEGKSGTTIWAQRGVHEGGVLAVAIHPKRPAFATAGQDGRVLIWSAAEGRARVAVEVGSGWVENVAWSPDGKWLAASCSRRVSRVRSGWSENLAISRSSQYRQRDRVVQPTGAGDSLLRSGDVLRCVHRGASPEAGVDRLPSVDGTEPGRGYRGLRQSRTTRCTSGVAPRSRTR